jgi:hypothetical protein
VNHVEVTECHFASATPPLGCTGVVLCSVIVVCLKKLAEGKAQVTSKESGSGLNICSLKARLHGSPV